MQKLGRYEIIEEIGRGGMAVVYLVRCREGNARQLALKMLQREYALAEDFQKNNIFRYRSVISGGKNDW